MVYVGYVSGVHGLRGDLKIKCKFEYPDRVFTKGTKIYLNDEAHTITNAKLYKGYYLTTIDNLKDINKVEKYIGYDVFILRENLNLKENEYLLSDLYDMEIISSSKNYGNVLNILHNGIYPILEIKYKTKYMIPLTDEYIIKVDVDSKKIICKDIERLIL